MFHAFALTALAAAVSAQATINSTSPLNSGDEAWLLISSALVFLMVPGLGLFYSGLAETKNSLTLMHAVLSAFSVACVQWALFGYSLAFSDTSKSTFIGNFRYGALLDTMNTQHPVAPTIPASLFSMYQMMFAAITPALFLGATGDRMKLVTMLVFVFVWTTIVYDPVAYWVWSSNGWLHNLNVMDYAGGSVVHVSSGAAAFVLAYKLGRRSDWGTRDYQNHNPVFVYIGTAMLWFGWMGFNGGSSTAANSRGVNAAFASNLAACMGGLVWMVLDTLVNKKKNSMIGFCTGAVAGLATITPGSGFVQPGFGLIFGGLASMVCFLAVKLMHRLKVDDSLDVTAVHGVGGALGMILTGLFAQHSVTDADVTPGTATPAGWVDHVWIQIPVQLAAIASVAAWSAAWTAIIASALDSMGLKLRVNVDDEHLGLDVAEIGEEAYPFVSSLIKMGSVDSNSGSFGGYKPVLVGEDATVQMVTSGEEIP
ncbi:ammonium transporter 1 [Chytriomyces sp. MP71]|nr:ammonium transporter 1 [Chytriomyces sp. MP71]